MSERLDINIFKDKSGFYIITAKNMKDILITKEALEDKEYIHYAITKAIKQATL